MTDLHNLIEKFNSGHRYFINIDIENGEKATNLPFENVVFENCVFSVDFSNTNFSNSKFISCNLKCSNFSNCKLTNTTFENCSLESTDFKNAQIENTILDNCHCYGKEVTLDKRTGELITYKHPLVKELYENIPEFDKIVDHTNDDLVYLVYDELGSNLFDDISTSNTVSSFTIRCFEFFNSLGDRHDDKIDNVLIVSVYETLYSNKKCNDIARTLLKGRNKEVYEYWMINGNIRADY